MTASAPPALRTRGETAGSPAIPRAFPLGDLPLSGGPVLSEAAIGYRSWGRLDSGGGNAILLPAHFPGPAGARERLIGPGRVFDPGRFFIVAVDLFGEGLSSAPSRGAREGRGRSFPPVSVVDNIRAQRRLLAALGVRRLRLVAGWSLGGLQSLFWAALHPDMVAAILAICPVAPWRAGTRRRLERMLTLLEGEGAAAARLRAFGRIASRAAHAPGYLSAGHFRDDGYATAELALAAWEAMHADRNPADLAAILRGWAEADLAALGPGGSRAEVLRGIGARAVLIGCDSDRHCRPADLVAEAALIPRGEARILRTPFGHRAGIPGRYPEETALIQRAIHDLLG